MIDLRQLYQLQALDLDMDVKREALARVEASLGESQEVMEARQALEALTLSLAELERKQRDLESEAEDLRLKAGREEARLYGGSVKNPRELAGIQAEVEGLKARLGQVEDTLLDIMTEGEAVKEEAARQRRQVEALGGKWQQEQSRLKEERAALRGDLAGLEARRWALASLVPEEALGLYERLRYIKQGRGVARVEGGVCQGCRVNLPLNDLTRARSGREVVECCNCGRILYVS